MWVLQYECCTVQYCTSTRMSTGSVLRTPVPSLPCSPYLKPCSSPLAAFTGVVCTVRVVVSLTMALLSEIAEFGAQTGKLKAPESWASSSPNAASAYWVRKWKQEVSGWLQVTMSDTLLRQTSLASACIGPKLRTL